MKRKANYQGMYMEMLHGAEKAISILSSYPGDHGIHSAVNALSILISAQLKCEEIYINSTAEPGSIPENILFLNIDKQDPRKIREAHANNPPLLNAQ